MSFGHTTCNYSTASRKVTRTFVVWFYALVLTESEHNVFPMLVGLDRLCEWAFGKKPEMSAMVMDKAGGLRNAFLRWRKNGKVVSY